jgi:uncharacterized membrane protein
MDIAIARALHLVGIVVWVGGMFFAQVALRPALPALAAPQRLALMAATLGRFLAATALAVVAVLGSGAWLVASLGGTAAMGAAVHAMMGLGAAMTLVYMYVAVSPFRALRAAVAVADWPAGAVAMGRVRAAIWLNLALGLVVVVLGAFSR